MTTGLVPPDALADWLIEVRHLAEDVETHRLDQTIIGRRLRELLDDMRATAYRKTEEAP